MHFVIAGSISCPQFTFAVMIAQRLQENLPNFTYLKISKKPEEWEKWLVRTCQENSWYHVKCPLIWKEIGPRQGKKEFVGDINEFLEICHDNYGIPIDTLSAEGFARGEMEWFVKRTQAEFNDNIKLEAKNRRNCRSRQVCITGASSQIAEIIIMELLKIPLQSREGGLQIRLFDEPLKGKKLQGSAIDAKYCPGPSGLGNCRVVNTLKEALFNVDLVIVLDCYLRKQKETLVKWLKRNRNAMCALGKALNLYAAPHCRVIIGSPSNQPICYNATVLASFATKLHVRNIVAVTHDLGRETLKLLSTKINVPIKNLFCPPVWGFVGLNKCIDINKTLQRHIHKVPGKRRAPTIPQGTEEVELRTTECVIGDDEATDISVAVTNIKSESYPRLGRLPCLAKATAIIDLLKVWGLKQEDGNGEILCLGVYSDGTFNIPQGIYWSQPVILKDGFWMPFAEYPIPRNTAVNCYYLFLYSVAALYRTKVKPRLYLPSEPLKKPKETKKFDFDSIAKKIGMPVIRTDKECYNYLKYLAKKELGIDFDVVDDAIEEELVEDVAPSEEVFREKIYCECWRQELKEIQKVVFDRSSTTEVEIDLSDNISGSEWSVINPKGKSSESELRTEFGPESQEKEARGSHQTGKTHSGKVSSEEKASVQEASSSTTVCSCGVLSTGVVCQCLKKEGVEEEAKASGEQMVSEELPNKEAIAEQVSTGHFYHEQNAEVFIEDTKDVIYADTYVEEQRVTFEDGLKTDESEKQFHLKFYGRKDAIRNKKADSKMRKRIKRYEEGDESSTFNVIEQFIQMDQQDASSDSDGSKETLEARDSHMSVGGVSFDFIGDPNGLNNLDEVQKVGTNKGSVESFSEMYSNKIFPSVQMIQSKSYDSTDGRSSGEGDNYGSIQGEDSYKDYAEMSGEISQRISANLFQHYDDFDFEGLFYFEEEEGEEEKEEEKEEEGEEEEKKAVTPKEEPPNQLETIKRQGIPLCCMCRCIVPEGLPCCPCGVSTVVEVFKKESLDVFVQSEDDISVRVEYFETYIPPESYRSSTSSPLPELSSIEISQPPIEKVKKELPPESFLPFSPKFENKFKETQRPTELTKNIDTDPLKVQPEQYISDKCAELLNMAKAQLEKEQEKSDKTLNGENRGESASELSLEDAIGMDFCDPKLFIPSSIEDWRTTVQNKYREWFFEGTNIRDDSYYDVAIEEVSEDECEIDKELEQYFEK